MLSTSSNTSTNEKVCDLQSVDVESQASTRRFPSPYWSTTVIIAMVATLAQFVAMFVLHFIGKDGILNFFAALQCVIICWNRIETVKIEQAVCIATEQTTGLMTKYSDQRSGAVESAPHSKYPSRKMANTIITPTAYSFMKQTMNIWEAMSLFLFACTVVILSWTGKYGENRFLRAYEVFLFAILYTAFKFQNERFKKLFEA